MLNALKKGSCVYFLHFDEEVPQEKDIEILISMSP